MQLLLFRITHRIDIFIDEKVNNSLGMYNSGRPDSKAIYGLIILPLIDLLRDQNITHKWYADYFIAAGTPSPWKLYWNRSMNR